MTTVQIKIIGQQTRYQQLHMFSAACNSAWSHSGELFPMYSDEGTIYEAGFVPSSGLIVAFRVVEISEFRSRLASAAERLYSQKMREAALKAADEVAAIYAEAFREFNKKE
jgi:hypothetical protein